MKNSVILSVILLIPFLLSAQCDDLNNHPNGKEAALELFVYRDFIKAKDYKQAFPKWEELYKCCKAGNGNILKDGIAIYNSFAENTLDSIEQHQYYLKVAQLMEERATCYGHKIRKKTDLPYYGFRYYQLGKHYYKNLNDYEKAAYYFEKSIDVDSVFIETNLISHYIYISKKRFWNEEITYDSLKNISSQLVDICDADTIKFKETKDNLYNKLASMHIRVFDCDYVVQKIKPYYEENKNNPDFDKMEIIKELKRVECDEANPFLAKVMDEYKNLIEIEMTTCPDIIDLGCRGLRDDQIEEAKKYFAQGIQNESISIEKRFVAAMRLAKLHQKDEEWEQALKYFNKAKELNPNSGEPYISKGMLYLSANKNCDGFERQLVAGGAIDQFRIAEKYKDTKEDARDKIITYSQYLPTKEMLFQRGLKIGAKITVGCILEVKTTIQAKD